jgi:hypothetical protein
MNPQGTGAASIGGESGDCSAAEPVVSGLVVFLDHTVLRTRGSGERRKSPRSGVGGFKGLRSRERDDATAGAADVLVSVPRGPGDGGHPEGEDRWSVV